MSKTGGDSPASAYSSFFDDIVRIEKKPNKQKQKDNNTNNNNNNNNNNNGKVQKATFDLGGYSDSDSDNQPAQKKKGPATPVVLSRAPPASRKSATPTPAKQTTTRPLHPPTPVNATSPGAAYKKHRVNKKDSASANTKMKEELLNIFDIYEKGATPKATQPNISSVSNASITDVLGNGNLKSDLLDAIKNMYSPSYWRDQLPQQTQLYAIDVEEQTRDTVGRRGIFDNPKCFALIEAMLKRNKVSTGSTPVTSNGNGGGGGGMGKDKVSMKEFKENLITLSKQEVITRRYEESMMTSPSDTENPCSQGVSCLCNEWFGFIMKEFISPLEYATMKEKGARLDVIKMCILCIRKAVAYAYMESKLVGFEQQLTCTHQPHSNMINTIGEYTYHYCLESGEGIVDPFVINYKQGYVYHNRTVDGVTKRWLTQDGYKTCDQTDIDELNFQLGTLRLEDANTKTDLSIQSKY